jgi:hypothetical protein
VKVWKKIYQANVLLKQTGVAIFISDKVDFKYKLIIKDKECHCILIKGATHQEEIKIINLHALNVSALNFIKHMLKDLNHR